MDGALGRRRAVAPRACSAVPGSVRARNMAPFICSYPHFIHSPRGFSLGFPQVFHSTNLPRAVAPEIPPDDSQDAYHAAPPHFIALSAGVGDKNKLCERLANASYIYCGYGK
jgi:hypothetical protein